MSVQGNDPWRNVLQFRNVVRVETDYGDTESQPNRRCVHYFLQFVNENLRDSEVIRGLRDM